MAEKTVPERDKEKGFRNSLKDVAEILSSLSSRWSNLEELVGPLEDAIVVVRGLSPHFQSPDDLIQVLGLAAANDGLLRLLLSEVTKPRK